MKPWLWESTLLETGALSHHPFPSLVQRRLRCWQFLEVRSHLSLNSWLHKPCHSCWKFKSVQTGYPRGLCSCFLYHFGFFKNGQFPTCQNIMIRDLVDAGVIRECTVPIQFWASSNFLRKPSGRGLRLIMNFGMSNAYSECIGWPFWSAVELQRSILPDLRLFWSVDFFRGTIRYGWQRNLKSTLCLLCNFASSFTYVCCKDSTIWMTLLGISQMTLLGECHVL